MTSVSVRLLITVPLVRLYDDEPGLLVRVNDLKLTDGPYIVSLNLSLRVPLSRSSCTYSS